MQKVLNRIFIILFFTILVLPVLFINLKDGVISLSEKRTLNEFPEVKDVSTLFSSTFYKELSDWFRDHIGFRDEMIFFKAHLDFYLFDKIDVSDMYIGKNGDLIYATEKMITSYQHKDLLTSEELDEVVISFKIIDDYLQELGISFLYVPCYDKHSIYPEQFMDSIYQEDDVSKRDQIVNELIKWQAVQVVDFKMELIEAKTKYSVYGNWNDPTHWTDSGAYVAYLEMMKEIRKNYDVKVLELEDYIINFEQKGYNLNGHFYHYDWLETFIVKDTQAKQISLKELGFLAFDERHSIYYNASSDNNLRLLILGDSYIESFLIDDLAESFEYTYMVWNSHFSLEKLEELIQNVHPDIILLEDAKRVDITSKVVSMAQDILAK